MHLRLSVTRSFLAVVVAFSLLPGTSVAQTDDPTQECHEELDRKFVLGIAMGLERFDTTLKITHKNTGKSIFIDAEENFGLPEEQVEWRGVRPR